MTQELTTISKFKKQLASPVVQDTFNQAGMDKKMLAKFTAIASRVAQENPALLHADRPSLLFAMQSAAEDNLMPDGREGALIAYGKKVQWQPMIAGIRKKLTKAGFDMRAEIVYEKDKFYFESGDDPKIIHQPQVFGDRGPIIGAYAIATNLETGEKYRETMDVEELEKIRLQSRGKDSPAWKLWKTEMFRKSVAKRLYKSLPIEDDSILNLIDRDNEQFETLSGVSDTAKDVQAAVRASSEPEPIEGELVEPEDMPPAPPPEDEEVDPLAG